MVPDDPLVHRARELARLAHAEQVRKAGQTPYFTHLEAVARILTEHGYGDATTLAAAYLHDLMEDQPEHADRMRAEMPREVIDTVRVLTERKRDDAGAPIPKPERFRGYVRALRTPTEAARRAIPISCADKIHNTWSIVAAERDGPGLLMALRTRPGEHAPQLAALREIYAPVVRAELLEAFDEARDALVDTISRWLPGRAVMIAAEAHLGQLDKGGHPYIEHPLRLMMRAPTREAKIVAVLHDVVEDSAWTLPRLRREGFSERVLRAVEALTKREGETYDAFLDRVGRDRLAATVKRLDLDDNRDLSRIPTPTDEDRARVAKYERAIEVLDARLAERSLQIELDDDSRARVRARALHPIVKGDHVTLAHRVHPEAFDASWVPGGAAVGDRVELRALREHDDGRIQALVVELAGASDRPFDGGTLHVTVSRVEGARSRESNDLIAASEGASVDVPLGGVVRWVEA